MQANLWPLSHSKTWFAIRQRCQRSFWLYAEWKYEHYKTNNLDLINIQQIIP